jgi:hypothetical protein
MYLEDGKSPFLGNDRRIFIYFDLEKEKKEFSIKIIISKKKID